MFSHFTPKINRNSLYVLSSAEPQGLNTCILYAHYVHEKAINRRPYINDKIEVYYDAGFIYPFIL